MWKRTFSNVTDKKNRLPLTTLKAFIVVSSRAATMQPSSTDPPSHSPANAAMLLRQRSAENSQSVNDRSRSTSRIKQARCCSLLSEQARPDWSETTKLVKRLTVMFSSIANLFWPTRGRRQWMLRAGEQRLARDETHECKCLSLRRKSSARNDAPRKSKHGVTGAAFTSWARRLREPWI